MITSKYIKLNAKRAYRLARENIKYVFVIEYYNCDKNKYSTYTYEMIYREYYGDAIINIYDDEERVCLRSIEDKLNDIVREYHDIIQESFEKKFSCRECVYKWDEDTNHYIEIECNGPRLMNS